MSALLDPDFLQRLAKLRLLARRRFAGAAGGARRSVRRGASAEFADHRPYFAGDDVRRIDWNAYARLEELVLRLYVAEEELTLYLLVDASRSLAFGSPPKIEVAKRIAAALAYVGLSGSERVGLSTFDAKLSVLRPPLRGKKHVGTVLRSLEGVATRGETNLSDAIEQLLSRRPRPGVVAIASDFLDPNGYERAIDRLIAEKFEPALFHVLSAEELDPPIGGDLVLVDSEHGAKVEATLDAATVRAYKKRLASFLERIAQFAKKRGVSYVRVDPTLPFEDALLAYFGAA